MSNDCALNPFQKRCFTMFYYVLLHFICILYLFFFVFFFSFLFLPLLWWIVWLSFLLWNSSDPNCICILYAVSRNRSQYRTKNTTNLVVLTQRICAINKKVKNAIHRKRTVQWNTAQNNQQTKVRGEGRCVMGGGVKLPEPSVYQITNE